MVIIRVIFVGIVFILTVSFSVVVLAIPVEAPIMPTGHHWLWGTQVNHITSRDINTIEGDATTNQVFITGFYGITDWLSIDGKIGIGDVTFDRDNSEKIDTDIGFAGGYGFRLRVFQNEEMGLKMIGGFQHISVHTQEERVNGHDYNLIWDEWQGSFITAKTWDKFTIYGGPRYSLLRLIYKEDGNRSVPKGKDRWGGALGIFGQIGKNSGWYVESGFVDEVGVTVGYFHGF